MKALGIMAVIIAGLFFWTLKQAEEIGELKATIRAAEAVEAYKNETQAKSQEILDQAAAEVQAAQTQLEEVTNERDRFRLIADNEAQKNPVDFGDQFHNDLAGWMQRISEGYDGQTGSVHPSGTETTGTADQENGPE